MKLSKLNKKLKRYQPVIQTVGIFLVLITVVLMCNQNSQSVKELAFDIKSKELENAPTWKVEFRKDELNALMDEIFVTPTRETYNIQKIGVSLMDGIVRYDFEYLGTHFSSASLKNRLTSIFRKHYDTIACDLCKDDVSYPIALTMYYEHLGEKSDTTALYDYHFRTYISDDIIRVKSLALNFISYTASDSVIISRRLISSNLASSFLSSISDAKYRVKYDLAMMDSIQKSIINYAYANVEVFERIVVIGEKKDAGLFVYVPRVTIDSVKLMTRNKIVDNLNKYSSKIDRPILDKILSIQEFEKTFKFSNNSLADSARINQKFLNENQWNKWATMNSELVKLVIQEIKI